MASSDVYEHGFDELGGRTITESRGNKTAIPNCTHRGRLLVVQQLNEMGVVAGVGDPRRDLVGVYAFNQHNPLIYGFVG